MEDSFLSFTILGLSLETIIASLIFASPEIIHRFKAKVVLSIGKLSESLPLFLILVLYV